MSEKEIDILLAGKEIMINGEKITIRPYTWAETLRMAKPLSVVLQTIFGNYNSLAQILSHIKGKVDSAALIQLTQFIGSLGNEEEIIDALSSMMAAAAGKDKDFISALMFDEVLTLGRTVYEVNKDFFMQRLKPVLQVSRKVTPEK